METKDTLSSCPGSEEQEMQRMQKQAKSMKQSCISFQYVFGRLCGEEFNTFKSTLSNNMDNIDKQLNKEILHKKDSKSALSVIKIQECKMQEVRALDASSGNTESSGIVSDKMSAKNLENDCSETGNDQSLGNESSTSRNASSRSGNECSERSYGNDTDINPSYDTEPMFKVPNSADYNVFAVEKQHTKQPEFINDTYVMEKNDSNITSDSSDMSHNVRKVDQHAAKHENERVLLASSIEKLKVDIEANKEIQKDLKKVNTSLIQDLEKYKLDLKYCKIDLERYKKIQTNQKDKEAARLKCKEALDLLASNTHKNIESSKTEAYRTFLEKEENAKLVNQIAMQERQISKIAKEKEHLKKISKNGKLKTLINKFL
ncbi:hypothetical protein Tco_1202939 [Tanacetum coccineum]